MSAILGFSKEDMIGKFVIIAFMNAVSNATRHCASTNAELSRGVTFALGADSALAIETRKKANNRATMNLNSMHASSITTNLNVGFIPEVYGSETMSGRIYRV